MRSDRTRWNRKYRDVKTVPKPSSTVERFAKRAPAGRALDIASGMGANSRFLAGLGFTVDAVDISDVALARLAGVDPNIRPICADLDDFDIPVSRYSLIVNTHFLDRRLFPQIFEGLQPGGMLIFDSYLRGANPDAAVDFHPQYLLRENELLHAFIGMQVVYYEERQRPHPYPDKPDRYACLVALRRG